MATQTIRFAAPADLTIKARLYPVGSATPFAAEADCLEADRGGIYSFTQSNSAGKYEVHLQDYTDGGAGEKLGVVYVETTNTAATFDCVEQRVDLEISADAETAAAGGGGGGGGLITGLTEEAKAQLAGVEIRMAVDTVTDGASLDIVRGCDYSDSDGTAKLWTFNEASVDHSETTATLTLKRGATSQDFDGTVTTSGENTWAVKVELTAAETTALAAANDWTYSLVLNLANGHTRAFRLPGHRARVLAR